ncbi:hypothetical protein [Gracilibacillus salinarum]|uniref:hypothetical protein n=1 Tax=Gracilibacillus salinarum TaxID=2932255 RepID=UPI0034E26AB5
MPYKLKIKGTIVSDDISWIYELFDIDHTSPSMVEKALDNANGDDLEILINSPGDLYSMVLKFTLPLKIIQEIQRLKL